MARLKSVAATERLTPEQLAWIEVHRAHHAARLARIRRLDAEGAAWWRRMRRLFPGLLQTAEQVDANRRHARERMERRRREAGVPTWAQRYPDSAYCPRGDARG